MSKKNNKQVGSALNTLLSNSAKVGIGGILITAGVCGALGTDSIIAEASNNDNVNAKVAQQVVSQFKDVNKGHYAYDAINWAKNSGIVSGYTGKDGKPNGLFGPNDSVTEAQFAKMLVEYLGLKDTKGDLLKHKYTPSSHWSDTYYDALASYGVPLNGYFDNGLRNQTVKRGVIAQSISHLTGNANSLTDSINFMLIEGITTGQNPSYKDKDLFKFFGSSNNLTRGQVASFLYRMHNVDIENPTGISLLVYNNKEGLSLVAQANKGINKLDKTLRLAKLGSETPPVNVGGNNGGNNNGSTNPTPPVENKPDFSNAKLPVSDSAKPNHVIVDELNKTVSKLSDNSVSLIKSEGYEVIMAGKDYITFTGIEYLDVQLIVGGAAHVSYSKDVNSKLVVSLIKDVTGITVKESDLYPSFSKDINSYSSITIQNGGTYAFTYKKYK